MREINTALDVFTEGRNNQIGTRVEDARLALRALPEYLPPTCSRDVAHIDKFAESVAITTNLAFPDWAHVFPDAMAANAVVDDRASCGRFRDVGPELPTTFSSEGIGEEK